MKTLLCALALSATLAVPAFAAEQTVRFEVGELTCPSCSFIVASSLKSVSSVVIGDFAVGEDASRGLYTVQFDDAETSVEAMIEAVEKNGYPIGLLTEPAGEGTR